MFVIVYKESMAVKFYSTLYIHKVASNWLGYDIEKLENNSLKTELSMLSRDVIASRLDED